MSLFSEEEQQQLLRYARSVLEAHLNGTSAPEAPALSALQQQRACFVTLHAAGDLRGCIGNIQAFEALGKNIARNAVNAGCHDPRFQPLTAAELPDVDFEISVLTPFQTISSYEEFRPGIDGIILRQSGRSAVFLPQVATEQHWSREETLSYLAQKAGLPRDAWRAPNAEFWVFQAEVFHEVK